MYRKVDVNRAGAGKFMQARSAVRDDDGLCASSCNRRGHIYAALFRPAGAEFGDDLHDNGV